MKAVDNSLSRVRAKAQSLEIIDNNLVNLENFELENTDDDINQQN